MQINFPSSIGGGSAFDAGRLLGRRLRQGHDRMAATRALQVKLMAMFGESA